MKVYISGKIGGLPDRNIPKFEHAEQMLRNAGYEPVNPHKLKHDHGGSWEEYMRVDIKELVDCHAIYLLDDWRESKGAKVELALAIVLGMQVMDYKLLTALKKVA